MKHLLVFICLITGCIEGSKNNKKYYHGYNIEGDIKIIEKDTLIAQVYKLMVKANKHTPLQFK